LIAGVMVAVAAVAAAGAGQAPLTCDDVWPAWSPDGRRVVFASNRTGDFEIYVLTLGSSGVPVRLTSAPGRDAHPMFSPDGTRIAFQSPREPGGHTNLYLMRADGTDQRRLTTHAGFAGVPAWSPDGRRVLYQWTPTFGSVKWRVMLLALDGSAPRELTDGTANDQVPNWAPDGRRFVFFSDRSGRDQLYSMTLDGAIAPLTTGNAANRSGAWSPDGRRIAFKSERTGPQAATFLMNADGTDQRRLGTIDSGHGVPFFSPDGRQVLITKTGEYGVEIWSLRVSDGSATRVSGCRRH
jgi:Tol biopolymer transport system component